MSERPNDAFREEAYELLTELETALLMLEECPDDMELISRVFRAMHTIKGSGAMFGFDEISAFTHEIETVFDLVRNGEIAVTKEMVDLCLLARDQIKAMLDASVGEARVDAARTEQLIHGFREFLPQQAADSSQGGVSEAEAGAGEDPPEVARKPALKTYRIHFKPAADIFANGTNPLNLLRELSELGEARVVAQVEGIAPLETLDPESCQVHWDIILTTAEGKDAIRDVFIFVEDDSEIRIEMIDDGGHFDDE